MKLALAVTRDNLRDLGGLLGDFAVIALGTVCLALAMIPRPWKGKR